MLDKVNKLVKKVTRKLSGKNDKKQIHKKSSVSEKKQRVIASVMKKTGWSYDETVFNIEQIEKRSGISLAEYDEYNLHNVPEEDVDAEYFKRKWAKKQRKMCIDNTMEKTGWDRKYTLDQLKSVRSRLGITYNDYTKFRFYKIPEEEQAARYNEILKQKADRKKESNARFAQEKEHHIQSVMEATGWDRQLTLDMQRRCAAVAGCDYEHYNVYRLYELTEREQQEYFTARYTRALRKRYNIDPEIIHIFRNKDKTCALLKDFLGRPCVSTVDMTLEDFTAATPETINGVYEELMSMPDGIVEGFLKQHPEMAKLSVNSVNTIRVATVKSNRSYPNVEKDKVYIVYAGLRMGSGSSYVDNLHSGGLIAGVDLETGIVDTEGVDFEGNLIPVHPDTGITIKGFQIPYWEEMKQTIEKAAETFKTGYFGWDIAITEDGPVIIEVNTSPGSVILQTPYVPHKKGMGHMVAPYVDPADVAPKYPLQDKEEVYLSSVMEKTGWNREQALEKITKAYVKYGIMCDDYYWLRVWELSDDILDTYFTTHQKNLIRARFNRDSSLVEQFYNKALTCEYFAQYLGRSWISTDKMDYETFADTFANISKVIYKPLTKSGGVGIETFEVNSDNIKQVYEHLAAYPSGIVEEYIVQHPEMARLSANSVNTIRVVTVKTQHDIPNVKTNAVNVLFTALRAGRDDSCVDNLSSGGMSAIINSETGLVETNAVDLNGEIFELHPNTGVKFVGFKIPYFEDIMPMLEEASKDISEAFLGWDIAITENGPVIVEVNTNPGTAMIQKAYAANEKGVKSIAEIYLA